MLATAVQDDLTTAWTLLEGEAGPVADPDTTILAIRRALDGDTVRALSSDPEGPRASVLLPRGDTLVSATAIVRSSILQEASQTTPLDLGLYLRGTRLQPSVASTSAGLPERIDPSPGWHPEAGIWVTPATASRGAAAAELVVAVRPVARRRAATTIRTFAAAGVLVLLALLSAWVGFAHPTRQNSEGPVVMAVLLMTLTTLVVSGWAALGESRVASADATRGLTWVSSLARARGVLDDPIAAQRWLGSPVIRLEGGRSTSGSSAPIPEWALDLPVPPPAFPVSGRHSDGRHWLAVSSGGGTTIFLADPTRTPPLLAIALGGSLIVLLGSLVVARAAASVEEFVPTGRG